MIQFFIFIDKKRGKNRSYSHFIRSHSKTFPDQIQGSNDNQLRSKSKIPDFERERIEVVKHRSNAETGDPIRRIEG